jgi:hypothetical protein
MWTYFNTVSYYQIYGSGFSCTVNLYRKIEKVDISLCMIVSYPYYGRLLVLLVDSPPV